MGALQGSLSYTRFYVEGDLPPEFRKVFTEAVQQRAFEPLTAEDEEEERSGWCTIEHPLDANFDNPFKLFFNEYLNLGMRVDRWRIPANLLKAYCTEAERAYLQQNNKDHMRKSERDEIKEMVTAELKRKILPTMKSIDMSWNIHTGIVRFWNQSGKTCEQFQDMFEKTFNLRLVPDNPYISAIQFEMDDSATTYLTQIEPTIFHRDDMD